MSDQYLLNSAAMDRVQIRSRPAPPRSGLPGVRAPRSLRWLLACALALAASAHAQLPEMALTINGHMLTAEVARTDPARTEGLMHRRILPENRGMLFVFREVALHAMWMMNTHVPLSVAFLDEKGVIINIEDMQPQTESNHCARKPARYALEMSQGWFAQRGIKPGARLGGIDRAPRPQ